MRRFTLALVSLMSVGVGCSVGPVSKDPAPSLPPTTSPAPELPSTLATPSPVSYKLGGAVTGLVRPGLALSVNGVVNLSVDVNGPFFFGQGLASGAAYEVSVAQQPAGEQCAVFNGTGSMASQDINDVSVVCAPFWYTVGGTIYGLQGTAVLQNGGDDLPIAADGSFVFPNAVPSGGSYAVSVITQPSSPHQTCFVTNGSGGVVDSDVTSISIQCATNVYVVNVQVNGLTDGGLVLQNNGGDDLPIAPDGIHAFQTAITDGQAYNVSVLTQPPNQTCTVDAPSSGTIDGSDVAVSVTCQ